MGQSIGDNELRMLSQRMDIVRPILFTGAGFSYGAINGNNETLPLGSDLKDILLTKFIGYKKESSEYIELHNQSLSDVYEYCENFFTPEKAADFLKELFSECTPKNYHSIIADYNWRKIYTINIDDLMERSSKLGKFVIQNQRRRVTSYNVDRKIEYIKLHGCVNNPNLGFIFSTSSYIDLMASGGDYRFQSLSTDLQTEDFVFIGTEMNEIDISFFFKLQKHGGDSRNGQLYFINPKPTPIFESKIQKYGGHIIRMTCEEFAEWLKSNKFSKNNGITLSNHFTENYRNVSHFIESHKNLPYTDSHLYFGYSPKWEDILFDWDFKSKQIEEIFQNILHFESINDENIVISLICKTLSGKSVFIKRLAYYLHNDGCSVYEYIGREFNYRSFINNSIQSSNDRIVLVVDHGSSYYSTISKLLNEYPKGKRLIVLVADRPFFHLKKRYCLVPHTNFAEYDVSISKLKECDRLALAQSIIKTLDDKGYLGVLKGKSSEECVKYILKINDLGSIVYNLTEGISFKKRYINNYNKIDLSNCDLNDALVALSIFQVLDLPYLPIDILCLWKRDLFSSIFNKLDDFIKFENNNGISLRTNILTNLIISKISKPHLMKIVKELLILIAPNISNCVSYWNDIQSRLMKVNLLHSKLNIPHLKIKEMFRKIKSYYNDDANYWIQVGIVEQKIGDYYRALNHFKQAEVLSPNSYLVQNALARNYLRMANSSENMEEAQVFFEEGKMRMLELIRNKDDYQVKAYSTHSYISELIKYWRNFDLTPNEDEVKNAISILNNIIKKDKNDVMTTNITNKFYMFLKEKNVTKYIPKLKMDDIHILKGLLTDDEQVIIEDYELD